MNGIRELKAVVCRTSKTRLREVGFIHKAWQKPDGIPAEEFEAEAAFFESGFLEKETKTGGDDFDFMKAANTIFAAEKKAPAYEKIPRPARKPANTAARKKRKKKKK